MHALAILLVVVACGSEPPPAHPSSPASSAHARALCEQLDSTELSVRTAAARDLSPEAGLSVGGSEQQLDAAARYCERTFAIKPAWAAN